MWLCSKKMFALLGQKDCLMIQKGSMFCYDSVCKYSMLNVNAVYKYGKKLFVCFLLKLLCIPNDFTEWHFMLV
jgi:hypothetical protein